MNAVFYGSEHERGLQGLFCSCNSREPCPESAGLRLSYRRTRKPVTSPGLGTPAARALSEGEEVWEPVFVRAKDQGS